jgi:hypothetical protein
VYSIASFFTKRNLFILAIVGSLLAAGLFYYFYFNRNQWNRIDLAQYAPASAVAFIQIDSLPDLLSGLTSTDAWRKLAPALGLSNQLEHLGSMTEFLASTGLGPEEAVLLARAQYAIIVDGLDLQTHEIPSQGGQELELVPRLVFLVETHAAPERVEQHLLSRVELLAHRIYGSEIDATEQEHRGVKLKVFRARELDRQLVAAQHGSLLLVGNQVESLHSCLDVLLGGSAKLGQDPNLKQARERLGGNLPLFAFVNGTSASRLLQLGSLSLYGGLGKEGSEADSGELAKAISAQILNGIAYGANFKDGQVIERYLTLLKPEIVDALQNAVKPAADKPEIITLVSGMDNFTLLHIDQPDEALEKVLAGVSANVNVVISFALRRLVIDLSRQYGIDPDDPIGALLGNEIALVKSFDSEDPKFTLLVEVNDKVKLLPTLGRYLRHDGGQVKSEEYQGIEIISGTGREERAAAFLGSYLALSKRDQIKAVIDAWKRAGSTAIERARIDEVFQRRDEQALVISSRIESQSAGELMLGLSRLLRATDGSREILKESRAQTAMSQLPASVSTARIISEGILIETESPLGAFTSLSGFLADPAGELRESRAGDR